MVSPIRSAGAPLRRLAAALATVAILTQVLDANLVGAAPNPATDDLRTACGVERAVSTGEANGSPVAAPGEPVRLVSTTTFGEGTVFQDLIERPDGTSFYASHLALRPDGAHVSADTAGATLTINAVAQPLVPGIAPHPTDWVLDTVTFAPELRVYLPGSPDQTGAGTPAWTTPAGGAVVQLRVPATVIDHGAGSPATGETLPVASCTASVANGESNQTTGPSPANVTIAEPNLVVTKTASSAVIAPGGAVAYTITVTNPARLDTSRPVATAYDVTITDTPPAGAGFVSASHGGSLAAGVVGWSIGPVPPGATVTRTVTFTTPAGLDPLASTPIDNRVDVAGHGLPASYGGGRASAADAQATVVVGIAPVRVTKTSDRATATIGAPVSFTVRATYPAGTAWFDALVWDELPDGTALVGTPQLTCLDCTGGEPAPVALDTVVSPAGTTRLGFALGDLGGAAADRTYELTYQASIAPTDAGGGAPAIGRSFTNTATNVANVAERSGGIVPNLAAPPAGDSIAQAAQTITYDKPVVRVRKVALASTVSPDDGTARYRVTVTNDGGVEARDVDVEDSFGGAVREPAAGLPPGVTLDNGRFRIGAIAPGGSQTIDYEVDVRDITSIPAPNIVIVTGFADPTGWAYAAPDTGASAQASVVTTYPMLTITKRAERAIESTAASDLRWTITIANTGTATAHQVELTDSPLFWANASLADPTGWTDEGWRWVLDTPLAPGAQRQVEVVTTLGGSLLPGRYENRAQVRWRDAVDRDGVELLPDHNWIGFWAESTASVDLVAPSLAVAKTPDVDDSPTPVIVQGTNGQYTITVLNTGSAPARGLVVGDVLPATLGYTSGAFTWSITGADAWPGAAPSITETGPGPTWTIDVLPPGATARIVMTVRQDGTAPAGNDLVNRVTVTGPGLPAAGDAAAITDVGTLVYQPAISPITVAKSVSPAQGQPGDTMTWTVTVDVPSNPVPLYDVDLIDVLPDGFAPSGAASVSCAGGCPTPAAVLAATVHPTAHTTSIGVALGDVPANTAPSTYTISIPTVVSNTFGDGAAVVDGAREPLVNRARVWFDMVTDRPNLTAGDPTPLAPTTVYERRSASAVAAYDVVTPFLQIDKTVVGRTPFSWTEYGSFPPRTHPNSYAANPGEQLRWRLRVRNTGAAEAREVTIDDDLASGRLQSVTFHLPAGVTTTALPGGGVRFAFASPLAPGASIDLEYDATLPDSANLRSMGGGDARDADRLANRVAAVEYHTTGAGQPDDHTYTVSNAPVAEVIVYTPTLATHIGPCLALPNAGDTGTITATWRNEVPYLPTRPNVLTTDFPPIAGVTPDPGTAIDPVWTITLDAGVVFVPGSVQASGNAVGVPDASTPQPYRDPDSIVTLATGEQQLTWNLAAEPYDRNHESALTIHFGVRARTAGVEVSARSVVTADDVTGSALRGTASGAPYEYKAEWVAGCAGRDFVKWVGDQVPRKGLERQGYRVGETVPWHLYGQAGSGRTLDHPVIVDELPDGTTYDAGSAVFTVVTAAGTSLLHPGDVGYPTETVAVNPTTGVTTITWTGASITAFSRVQVDFTSTVDADVTVGQTLVNYASFRTDQPVADNCVDTTTMCDVSSVLVLSSVAPTITKTVLTNLDATHGATSRFQLDVSIPAGRSFEDLTVRDDSWDGFTSGLSSITPISATCIAGCTTGGPDDLVAVLLPTVNDWNGHPRLSGWWLGDVASDTERRTFRIVYDATTLTIAERFPSITDPAGYPTEPNELPNIAEVLTFPGAADRTTGMAGNWLGTLGGADVEASDTATITRGRPVVTTTKTCRAPSGGVDTNGLPIASPATAGINLQCTITLANDTPYPATDLVVRDTPSPDLTVFSNAPTPVDWSLVSSHTTSPMPTPTTDWDDGLGYVEWRHDPADELEPGDRWTFTTSWHVDPWAALDPAETYVVFENTATVAPYDDEFGIRVGNERTVTVEISAQPTTFAVAKLGPGDWARTPVAQWPSAGLVEPARLCGFSSPTFACAGSWGRAVQVDADTPADWRLDVYLNNLSDLTSYTVTDLVPEGLHYVPGSAKLVVGTPQHDAAGRLAGVQDVRAIAIDDPAITLPTAPSSCGTIGQHDHTPATGTRLDWSFARGLAGWRGAPWNGLSMADGFGGGALNGDFVTGFVPTAHVTIVFRTESSTTYTNCVIPRMYDEYVNEVTLAVQSDSGRARDGNTQRGPRVDLLAAFDPLRVRKSPDPGYVADGSTGRYTIDVEWIYPQVTRAGADRWDPNLAVPGELAGTGATDVTVTDTIVDDGLYVPGSATAVFVDPRDGVTTYPAAMTEESVTPITVDGRAAHRIVWRLDHIPGGILDSTPANPFGITPGITRITVPLTPPAGTPDGTRYPNSVSVSDDLTDDGLPWGDDILGDPIKVVTDDAALEVRRPAAPPQPAKTVSPATVAPGGTQDWTIATTLPAGALWFDLGYRDVVPAGLRIESVSAPQCRTASGASCDAEVPVVALAPVANPDGSRTLAWWYGDIEGRGEDRTVTVVVRTTLVDPAARTGTTYVNRVRGFSNDADLTTATPSVLPTGTTYTSPDAVAVATVGEPQLAIDKVATTTGPLGAGASAHWTVTVTNTGTSTAYEFPVVDHPAPGIELAAPEAPNAALATKGWTTASPSTAWFVQSLAPGASITFGVRGTIAADVADRGITRATNTAIAGPYGSQRSTNADRRTYVEAEDDAAIPLDAPALAVRKFADPGCTLDVRDVAPGASVTWCVQVTNGGSMTAPDVHLTDVLPYGFTLASAAPAPTSSSVTAWGATTAVWSLGGLAPGTTATVLVTTPAGAGAASTSVNAATAVATLPNGQPGTGVPGYWAGDDAAVRFLNERLQVAKTPDQRRWTVDPVTRVATVEWDLTVTNPSPAATTHDVTLTDLAPAGTTFVRASRPPTTLGPAGAGPGGTTSAIWALGDLAPGEVVTVTVAYAVVLAPNVTHTVVRNVAEARSPDLASDVVDDAYATVYLPIRLGDLVWSDTDRDGRQGASEAGVAGVSVHVFGTDVFGEPVDRTTTTDEHGRWLVEGLAPGTYTVTITPPAGRVFTRRDAGPDDTADSDVDAGGTIAAATYDRDDLDLDAGLVADDVPPTPEPVPDPVPPPAPPTPAPGPDPTDPDASAEAAQESAAPRGNRSPLALTGSEAARLALVSLVLVAIGGTIVAGTRRRAGLRRR